MNRTRVAGLGAVLAAGVSIAAAAARPDATPAAALDGSEVFGLRGCATCHEGPGVESTVGMAPSLVSLHSSAATRVDGLSASEYVEQSIRNPGVVVAPGWAPNGPLVAMPAIALSDEEVTAIVDYLLAEPVPVTDATG